MVNGNQQLPDGWKWIELHEACTKIQDGTHFSPKTQYLKSAPGRFLYITAKNIKDYGVDLSDVRYIDEAVHRTIFARCNPERGDLLLTKDGVKTGEITVNQLQEQFSLLSSVALLKPKRDLFIPLFLKYYLSSPFGYQAITGAMTGTAIKRIILEKIRLAKVPIAPLPEQERIVAKIEELFTQLEAGTSALERVQAGLRRYKASVLKAAVEGRLANGNSELAEDDLPEGWQWTTVGELADKTPYSITDGPFGSKLKTEHYTAAGPRVIRLQNIGEGEFRDEEAHISQEHFETLQRHRIYGGDLVIAGLGESLPRACIIPDYVGEAIVKADCIRFKPNPELADTTYLLSALNSDPVKKLVAKVVHGIGRPRMNQQEIKAIPIPLPPLAEQRRIVAEVERRLSVARQVESSIEAALVRAARLRQTVLRSAFEGRLT
jgi:type I restriction enzyme, S subunit